ncbi:hypothetical protein C9J12_21320 [Photobacterium frigidiphilum]|uniref:Uncharacterized protein n=1 Tax=Photobacterium frigidiphilum TaxID=264736 RepID=A0A2T3JAB5_9GAMM|nr:hypothetical protein [Photobacterium frigidiphilum]PSU45782.1 hypothetical protein C9J12_21320 [Photobacterium frigidiphilum]
MANIEQLIDLLIPDPILSSTAIHNRKQRRSSILDPYRLEIMTLYDEFGQSGTAIQIWLAHKKNIYITKGMIYKRIQYWRKLNESMIKDEKQRQI